MAEIPLKLSLNVLSIGVDHCEAYASYQTKLVTEVVLVGTVSIMREKGCRVMFCHVSQWLMDKGVDFGWYLEM